MGRAEDAVRLRQALAANPKDRIAWHNLASAEGDLGRVRESEEAARRAIALGLAAPETRLVLARALQGQRRLDEAERAFEDAISRRPAYADAHRDLAQLRWMRTRDQDAALRRLRTALGTSPRDNALRLVESVVLEACGNLSGALASAQAGLAHDAGDLGLLRHAAHLTAESGDAEGALALAERAATLAPEDSSARMTLCESLLGAGRVEAAGSLAAALVARHPTSQYVLALQATAWRLAGDARYAAIHDYDALVQQQPLETPEGWPSLAAFVAALVADLESMHDFITHPLQQSVRGGSQLPLRAPEFERPLVRAAFESIARAVQRYVDALGTGPDPLRARNTGRFAITEAWSIRLRSGGHHTDHIHPHGWMSSALHLALPPATAQGGRAGWLRLGKPAFPTRPSLGPERFVRPLPGSLVLFPAYMWHGVEPFEDEAPRTTIAFDILPA